MDEAVIISDLANRSVKKTAIFRALQLGDMLCAIPAVRAFKAQYPDSEITLIGLPWADDFARRFSHYFSSFIAFPGYKGLVEQPFDPGRYESFLSEAGEMDFDLIVQMHGNGSVTNRIVGGLNAKIKAGYCRESKGSPGRFFMPYPEGISEIERHLLLMSFLGITCCGTERGRGSELEFPITAEENDELGELYDEFDLKPNEYVCIHPGARDERRRWSPEAFAKVSDAIVNHGFKVALTGTRDEAAITREVERSMRHKAVNLAGRTGLGVLAGLIKSSRLLICNDTGVSHVAAALTVPSVVIFSVSDPSRWAPLNRRLHRAILSDEAENIDLVLFNVERKLLDENFNRSSLRVA